MKASGKQFVVCLKNKGYEVSLERRKIYQVLPILKQPSIGRFESSTSQAKTTYIHKLSSRRLNSHNLYAEPFWLRSNRPVNADARATAVLYKGRFARAGYWER